MLGMKFEIEIAIGPWQIDMLLLINKLRISPFPPDGIILMDR